MKRISLGRLTLQVLIAGLIICALIGTISLLTRSFGRTQGRIMLSLLPLAGGTLLSSAAAAQVHRSHIRYWAFAAIGLATLGAVFTLLGIWVEKPFHDFWKIVASAWIAATAICHVSLTTAICLHRRFWMVVPGASLLLVTTAIFILLVIWSELDIHRIYRPLGVLSILTVLFTILVPVLRRLGTLQRPHEVQPDSAEPAMIRVLCPSCSAEQTHPLGEITCPYCRCRFVINLLDVDAGV